MRNNNLSIEWSCYIKNVAFSKCKYEYDILNSYKQKRQKLKRSVSEYANDAEKTIEKFALSLSLSLSE